MKTAASRPPGPAGEFFIGSAREAIKDCLAFNLKYWRQFGDCLYFHALPGISWYLFAHPDAVEHILQTNQKNYQKPRRFRESFGLLGGNGLLTSDGDIWLRQRRLMQPTFHRDGIERMGALMSLAIAEQLQEWDEREDNRVVDVFHEMLALSLRVIGRTLFSEDLSLHSAAFRDALDSAIDHISRQTSSLLMLPEWLPTKANLRFAAAKQILNQIVLQIIERRRKQKNQAGDLLDMLILAADSQCGSMSDRQLRDEILTLLVTGHETVAVALAWTFYLLGKHPEVKFTHLDELRSVLDGRIATYDDISRLPYNRMIFQEALRMYPPTWALPREAKEEDVIQGFYVPKGAAVTVCQYITHRHPEFWDDPESFEPERFLPEKEVDRPKFAYFPFGGGGRTCIANNFALLEGQLALASISQRFDFELIDDQTEPAALCTLRPLNGIKARMRKSRTA